MEKRVVEALAKDWSAVHVFAVYVFGIVVEPCTNACTRASV